MRETYYTCEYTYVRSIRLGSSPTMRPHYLYALSTARSIAAITEWLSALPHYRMCAISQTFDEPTWMDASDFPLLWQKNGFPYTGFIEEALWIQFWSLHESVSISPRFWSQHKPEKDPFLQDPSTLVNHSYPQSEKEIVKSPPSYVVAQKLLHTSHTTPLGSRHTLQEATIEHNLYHIKKNPY